MGCSPPGSSVRGDSPGKTTGVGCHALLQGILPTQGSSPGLSHCRWILYHLSHQGSPGTLERQYSESFKRGLSSTWSENLQTCKLGFKDTGARDQTDNTPWLIENAREFQKSAYFCFTDNTKAFDYVDHNQLWKITKEVGTPDHLTCMWVKKQKVELDMQQ